MTSAPRRHRPLRVLWVTKGLGPGGAERLLVAHAQAGDRDRFDYHAAYLVPTKDQLATELRAEGVSVTCLDGADATDPRWVGRLVSLVRRERIDVVHLHSPLVAALARPALRTICRNVRVVYTEHNSWECYSAPTRLANALTYPLDHARVAVSGAAAASAPAGMGRSTVQLDHGIDVAAVRAGADREGVRKELEVDEDMVVIGTVANLRAEKNLGNLLQAARLVLDRRPGRVRFALIGQGPLEAEIRALHARLGLGEDLRLLGFQPDGARWISGFDAFVLSSDHEGLPVAVMEARAHGVPVIATSVGGLVDVVHPGEDGLLVPPGNSEALASAIVRLVDHPEEAAAWRAASLRPDAQFDVHRAVERIERIYEGVG